MQARYPFTDPDDGPECWQGRCADCGREGTVYPDGSEDVCADCGTERARRDWIDEQHWKATHPPQDELPF